MAAGRATALGEGGRTQAQRVHKAATGKALLTICNVAQASRGLQTSVSVTWQAKKTCVLWPRPRSSYSALPHRSGVAATAQSRSCAPPAEAPQHSPLVPPRVPCR